MKAQPMMKPEEIKVLREKLGKVIGKRYLNLPDSKLLSLIKFFAVPKGVVDGEVQDWRIVYHAGAHGLNDCVWAPLFWLPSMDSMLRTLDLDRTCGVTTLERCFSAFPFTPMLRCLPV